ncbi:hypothetical protein GCM10011532_29360 [Christiangramia forsetii]|uniref:Uncharacterized protein n=1 Tax=Christiangramia forsetii TaxID=411153 RepID=A0ABQ1WS51_9FLAO|nr:hypothetical protein GCM10011532_29360 [Christiangramia forsetii]
MDSRLIRLASTINNFPKNRGIRNNDMRAFVLIETNLQIALDLKGNKCYT